MGTKKMYAVVHYEVEVPEDMTDSDLEKPLRERFKGIGDPSFQLTVWDQEIDFVFCSLYCSRP